VDVLLTADRTMMSTYHSNEFVGFGTTAPENFFPNSLYQWLIFPPMKTKRGVPPQAPYGLRKIEAQLLEEGFNVLTVDPDHLRNYIGEAKVLGVHVMDPFGLGPATTTFVRTVRTGESFLAKYFRSIFAKPEVRQAKKKGLKIIVGGPGAWQFKYRSNFMKEYGIDCVVEGECERIVGDLVRKALNGRQLPNFLEASIKDAPNLNDIPEIKNPSINGLIEIGRGCCRGCAFCSVTLRPLRWYPPDKIERELKVNISGGINYCTLHAEDVMLYGSKNVMPNREKILSLHKMVKKHVGGIGWSHASCAAVAADPKLFSEIADIVIDERQRWWGAEIGIETGSPRLIEAAMPAKANPFKPEEWPEVVKTAAGTMMDNGFVAACTLIVGLNEETEDDIIKTIELVDDLKDFRSVIVPLFFVPMGKLKNQNWFEFEELSAMHKQLLSVCVRHDLYWTKKILDSYFEGQWRAPVFSVFFKFLVWYVNYKARKVLR
jgi:radical SAM superfamily enzyme YgiQ (UPF0313 family)